MIWTLNCAREHLHSHIARRPQTFTFYATPWMAIRQPRRGEMREDIFGSSHPFQNFIMINRMRGRRRRRKKNVRKKVENHSRLLIFGFRLQLYFAHLKQIKMEYYWNKAVERTKGQFIQCRHSRKIWKYENRRKIDGANPSLSTIKEMQPMPSKTQRWLARFGAAAACLFWI